MTAALFLKRTTLFSLRLMLVVEFTVVCPCPLTSCNSPLNVKRILAKLATLLPNLKLFVKYRLVASLFFNALAAPR